MDTSSTLGKLRACLHYFYAIIMTIITSFQCYRIGNKKFGRCNYPNNFSIWNQSIRSDSLKSIHFFLKGFTFCCWCCCCFFGSIEGVMGLPPRTFAGLRSLSCTKLLLKSSNSGQSRRLFDLEGRRRRSRSLFPLFFSSEPFSRNSVTN